MEKLESYSEKAILAALDVLSPDEKDEIVMSIIATYEQDIVRLINNLATDNGMKITVACFEVRKS